MNPTETDARVFAEHNGRLEFLIENGKVCVRATAFIRGNLYGKVSEFGPHAIALLLRGFSLAANFPDQAARDAHDAKRMAAS